MGQQGGFGMWSMISTHATGLEFRMGWDSWLAWETIPLPTRSIGGVWSPALYWVRFRCGLVGRGFPLNRKCWHPAPLQPSDTHRENSCANFYHSYKKNPCLLLSLGMPWNHSWHNGQCAACAATYLTYVCRKHRASLAAKSVMIITKLRDNKLKQKLLAQPNTTASFTNFVVLNKYLDWFKSSSALG